MKRAFIVLGLGLTLGGNALAKDPQASLSAGGIAPTMMDPNFTIFGSSDGIVAKLMIKANAFCFHE